MATLIKINTLELRLLELRTEVRELTDMFQHSLYDIDYERIKLSLCSIQEDSLMLNTNSPKFKKRIKIFKEAVNKLFRQMQFCSPFELLNETLNVNTQTNTGVTQINNEEFHETQRTNDDIYGTIICTNDKTKTRQENNKSIHEVEQKKTEQNEGTKFETNEQNKQLETDSTININELPEIPNGYDSDRTEFEFPMVEENAENKQSANDKETKTNNDKETKTNNSNDLDLTEIEFPLIDMEKNAENSTEIEQLENDHFITDTNSKQPIVIEKNNHEEMKDREKPYLTVNKYRNAASEIKNIGNTDGNVIDMVDFENVHISDPHSSLLLKTFKRISYNRRDLSTCAPNSSENDEHNIEQTFYKTLDIQTRSVQTQVIDSNKTKTNADTTLFLCPVSGIFEVQGPLSEQNEEGYMTHQLKLEQTVNRDLFDQSIHTTTKANSLPQFIVNMRQETNRILQEDNGKTLSKRDQNKMEIGGKIIEQGNLINRTQPKAVNLTNINPRTHQSENREDIYKSTEKTEDKVNRVQLNVGSIKTGLEKTQQKLSFPMKHSNEIVNNQEDAANSKESLVHVTQNTINVYQTLSHVVKRMKDRKRNPFIARINANDASTQNTANQSTWGHSTVKYYGQSQPKSLQYTQPSQNYWIQNSSNQQSQSLNISWQRNLSQNQENSQHCLATIGLNSFGLNEPKINSVMNIQSIAKPVNSVMNINSIAKPVNSIMDIQSIAKPIYFMPEPGDVTSTTWTLEDLKMFT